MYFGGQLFQQFFTTQAVMMFSSVANKAADHLSAAYTADLSQLLAYMSYNKLNHNPEKFA